MPIPKQPKDSKKSPEQWWFDTQIAPKLMALCLKCQARGMSFIALVETDGELGVRTQTCALTPGVSFGMTMMKIAADNGLHLDKYIMSVAQLVRENGIKHQSVMLQAIGLDPDPEKRKPAAAPATDTYRQLVNGPSPADPLADLRDVETDGTA